MDDGSRQRAGSVSAWRRAFEQGPQQGPRGRPESHPSPSLASRLPGATRTEKRRGRAEHWERPTVRVLWAGTKITGPSCPCGLPSAPKEEEEEEEEEEEDGSPPSHCRTHNACGVLFVVSVSQRTIATVPVGRKRRSAFWQHARRKI